MLGSGDGVALQIGSAQVERYRIEVGSAEVEPAAPAAGRADAGAPRATTAAAAPAPAPAASRAPPTSFDVSLPAGESAIIHGQQTPLVIRLAVATPLPRRWQRHLERGRQGRPPAGRGPDQALFTVASGNWSYRYECERQELRRGTLTVRRDAGTERLPRVAPANVIEADGRRYTVLYQNRLPSLTFSWPDAPARPRLHAARRDQGTDPPLPGERPPPAAGLGRPGRRHLPVVVRGQRGQGSRRTTVTVRFDNAAVTAQVETPRDGVRITPGDEIEVAGVAIEGSTVAVGAAPLDVDEQGRFRGKVTPPAANERSIAIRLAHPKSGVHYYVRRIVQ